MTKKLFDGWYLMSTGDLEHELARFRSPEHEAPPSRALRLSNEDALAYRNSGNLPDAHERTLRLVLLINDAGDLAGLEARRLSFEPDYHDAPTWRREGSHPVNVVPLRRSGVAPESSGAWWDDPSLAGLEREFQERGTAAGVAIPGEYRGFIFKTVLALRAQGREVTPQSICDSIARWLPDEDVSRIAAAMAEANR